MPLLGAALKKERYEYRLSRIALAYAKGWLLIDVVSFLPSVIDIVGVLGAPAPGEGGGEGGGEEVARMVRAVK